MKKTLLLSILYLFLQPIIAQENATSLDSLFKQAYQAGDWAQAIKWTEASIQLAEKSSQKDVLAEKTQQLATLYLNQGNYQDAIASFLNVLPLQEEIYGRKSPEYIITLTYIGLLYDELEEYESAKEAHLEANELVKVFFGKDSLAYAQSLGNLASVYLELEEFKTAENYYLEAIECLEKRSSEEEGFKSIETSLATNYHNLATLYKRTKRFPEAERMLLKARNILKKNLGERQQKTITNLNNLGALYANWGQYQKAESIYLETMELYKEVVGSKHPLYFQALNNLTSLYLRMGENGKCLTYVQKSLNANIIADTPIELDDIDGLDNAVVIHEPAFINSLGILINLYSEKTDKAQLQKSYIYLDLLLKRTQKIQKSVIREKDKFRKLSQISAVADQALKISLLLGEENDIAHAFEFAEQNKSILLANVIQAEKAKILSNLPDSIIKQEAKLQEEWSKLKKEFVDAKNGAERKEVRAALNTMELQLRKFQEKLEKEYPKYQQLKYKDNLASAKDIQSLLDKHTAFLEFFVGDSSTYVFFLDKEQIAIYPIAVSSQELSKQIRKFRELLTDYNALRTNQEEGFQLYIQYGYQLYQELLETPLKQYATNSIKQLIIIPDGELGHIPFEALLNKKVEVSDNVNYQNLPYLLKTYRINYNYSATLFKENKKSASQSNVKVLAMAASYNDSLVIASSRSPYLRNLRRVLSPLPAAKKEVEAISQLASGRYFIGENANEKTFKDLAKDYGVIHLAMHGILNTQKPMLSSLAFSENNDSLENNFLQAYEIAQMDLANTELVVLSACETGYGRFQNGEGVMSLARSFMYAGVPSLVVSLWQVNDMSTSLIMEDFYKELAKNQDKATALQQAKLKYISNSGNITAHPAFWAAFIQLGEPAPLHIVRPFSWVSWLWVIGIPILVIIGFWLTLRNRNKEEV